MALALAVSLCLGGSGHAAGPASLLCRPDTTLPPVDAAIYPASDPSPLPFTEAPGLEDALGTLVGEPVRREGLRYEDVAATGPIWLYTTTGVAIGRLRTGSEFGRSIHGWKAFPQRTACFEEPVPSDVLKAGPEGYDFASGWRSGAVWYTLWNKRSGDETLLMAITPEKSGPAGVRTLATLGLKAKALSIQPGLHDGVQFLNGRLESWRHGGLPAPAVVQAAGLAVG